jgi:hypothetical protein
VKRFVSLQFLNFIQSVGLLARGMSPSQGRYVTQTDIHASSGIRTHDLSVRAGEDIRTPVLCIRMWCEGVAGNLVSVGRTFRAR